MSKKMLKRLMSQIDRAAKVRKREEIGDSGEEIRYEMRDTGLGIIARISYPLSIPKPAVSASSVNAKGI
jgi:hypothetical protein